MTHGELFQTCLLPQCRGNPQKVAVGSRGLAGVLLGDEKGGVRWTPGGHKLAQVFGELQGFLASLR